MHPHIIVQYYLHPQLSCILYVLGTCCVLLDLFSHLIWLAIPSHKHCPFRVFVISGVQMQKLQDVKSEDFLSLWVITCVLQIVQTIELRKVSLVWARCPILLYHSPFQWLFLSASHATPPKCTCLINKSDHVICVTSPKLKFRTWWWNTFFCESLLHVNFGSMWLKQEKREVFGVGSTLS